jgi:ubiquinone/menaquinone biosynthesis C-methylase UbiE
MMVESRTYFETVAPQWDALRKGFFSDAVREKALDVAGVEPGRLAADIGAGSGFVTEGLLRRGLRVIAVDRSEAMLEEMRRKFGEGGAVDYLNGGAEALPLEDRSVDYAFANMCLHHVDSPPAAIREMARIVKPGGRLVITDLDRHNFEFLRTEHCDRWMGFDRPDVALWMSEAGLQDVQVDCAGENCCAASQSGDREAAVGIFVAWGIRRGHAHMRPGRVDNRHW